VADAVTAEIVVTCSDSGHQGKTANIIKFQRGAASGGWLMGPVTGRGQLWPRPYDQYLIGDTPVDPDGRLDPADKAAARGRASVGCGLCGVRLDLRAERLHPILDRMAEAGVSHCELAHLVRRVSSST
jgi:hypothetical protein